MRGIVLALVPLLLGATHARAQERPARPDSIPATLIVPAGTRLHGLLERRLTRRTSRPGDSVYLQLDHPVVVHDTVAMPAGTFLEGVLNDVAGSAGHLRARLHFQLIRLVYPNGYVLATSNPIEGVADAGVRDDPSPAASLALLGAVVLGGGVGALTAPTSAAAGAVVGTGLGLGTLALVALFAHVAVALDEGTALDLVLRQTLVLDARRATAPGTAALRPRPRPPARPAGLCFSPGSPGTPDVVIPGTPATPDVVIPGAAGSPDVVIPGTPGTPPTVIPGMPATPGSWQRCGS